MFFKNPKRPKNFEIAKPFYFWQTVSKISNLADLTFKKASSYCCRP
jgi:hypothetical protein